MSEGKRNLTSIAELLGEMNGGTVEQMANIAISDAALNVMEFDKNGEITLKIKLQRIGESQQVNAVATLSYKIPTKRGSRSEDYAVDTPLYVGKGGRLTVLPENQIDIFTKKTRVEQDQEDMQHRH